jgi:hypothetical protein
MFNFIVVVAAALMAIWQGCYRNDVAPCLIDIGAALINLPFAIKWLIDVFNK